MGYFERRSCARVLAGLKLKLACLLCMPLAACSSLGASGPSVTAISAAGHQTLAGAPITVIDVTDTVTRRLLAVNGPGLFSQSLGDAPPTANVIGAGDVLQVTIWEAPPAVLFGGNATFGSGSTSDVLTSSAGVGQRTALPEMMVDASGRIRVPFAGAIPAAGRTPQQVEREIVSRLTGMAHDPQVAVQIARNSSSTVAVVGEVATAARVPLTPQGERLLDVLASAGGVKQPVEKMTIQVSRGGRVAYMPLEAVIRDPAQNIRLGPNDVVTALYKPFSFTALGATNTSAEIPFEATGLTLAQALGRVGGLKDERANIRGAYIFRFEDPAALDPAIAARARPTPDGRIPVIYRVDLRKPETLFVAQGFPMRDKDVLYVTNAPLTDIQRFVSILSSMAFTFIGLGNAVP
jgi:polysaccharide export outer membrane protein